MSYRSSRGSMGARLAVQTWVCQRLSGCWRTESHLYLRTLQSLRVNSTRRPSLKRRRSLSLPVLTLIFPALLPCLVRDSLCTALQTKILWINWSLNAIDTIETWVSGNLTALTERSQPAIRWRVGEVVNRVSCGSFCGGHWYLPIRNHDNRYFSDWIRLCPGLSKNSENGNSCPKPHKAAGMIEAVGRAVSIETETIIAIWILPRRSSRLYKGKLIKMETKMVKMDRE